MFSDGVIDLFRAGVYHQQIQKETSAKDPHLVSPSAHADFMISSMTIPLFAFLESDYVNGYCCHPEEPKRWLPSIVTIEIDLTGQVCADSIGTYQFSGLEGRWISCEVLLCLKEESRLLPWLPLLRKENPRLFLFSSQGAGVVTTRAHVHYVVTKMEIANLYGKNLEQRAHELNSNCAIHLIGQTRAGNEARFGRRFSRSESKSSMCSFSTTLNDHRNPTETFTIILDYARIWNFTEAVLKVPFLSSYRSNPSHRNFRKHIKEKEKGHPGRILSKKSQIRA
jgi:hypothetical protein